MHNLRETDGFALTERILDEISPDLDCLLYTSLGGLGLLQDAIVQLAGILGQPVPDISRRAAVVFCADNGVVAEGVTQCGQDVYKRQP